MLIPRYAIKFRVAVIVFIAVIAVMGSISYVSLPREGYPDVTVPFVFVTAVYEGVAPEEIENLVTIPLEKQFNNLPNVKEITSTSIEGVSSVAIEFMAQQNIDEALQKVKDRIDLAVPDLPDDLDKPVAKDFNLSTEIPVLVFALSGDVPLELLKNVAEDLEDRLERIPAVLQANVWGTREREIRVEIDIDKFTAYGFSPDSINTALFNENVTLSAGNIVMTGGDKFHVRVPGEFKTLDEIRGTIISADNGRVVRISDIAEVYDTYKDIDSITRINGKPCVSVSVQKRTGENSIDLIDRARQEIDSYRLPEGVEIIITQDQSRDIRLMLSELENNVAAGMILVVLVLMIFMGGRNSLLVAVAIPLSMLISFMVLMISGLTLNMVVLFSLVVALGMLVDNAIVIVENIYRHHSDGESRVNSAFAGSSEVAWPVITSTLTTLAAFFPLLFWPDVMGEFMKYLPMTLICTLTSSLFVAMVINPAVCSFLIHRQAVQKKRFDPFAEGASLMRRYEKVLRYSLAHRGFTVLICIAGIIFTQGLFHYFSRGTELFPDVDPPQCDILVSYPEGTPITAVDETLRSIESSLGEYEDIRYILTNAGSQGEFMGSVAGSHVGSINIRFDDFEDRTGSTRAIIAQIRKNMPLFPGAEVRVKEFQEGPPSGAPVSIEVSGDDFDELSRISGEIQRKIKNVPGLVDIQDNIEDAKPELRIKVDRDRAALLGIDTRFVADLLKTSVDGSEASKFRIGEDEYDITLRLPLEQRNSVALFNRIKVRSISGAMVPLSSIGVISYAGGRGAITRKDQRRTITIDGYNQGRGTDKILKDVRQIVDGMKLPAGYYVSYGGDNEEMERSGRFLKNAFGTAIAMIAVVLVLQFNSPVLPMVIMLSVILSLIGVMWGLLICRMKFGVIMTGVGVISLAGIVVNNAIVLIDCIIQHQRNGISAVEAVIIAGKLRMRPVLLTATTTILGLLPMAIGYGIDVHTFPPEIIAGSETSAWWAPMAVAIIFGLTVSTVLTLAVVPVMYSLSDSLIHMVRPKVNGE